MGINFPSHIDYGNKTDENCTAGIYKKPTVRQQTELQIKELNEKLAELINFLQSLDRVPGLEDVLNTMRKLGL